MIWAEGQFVVGDSVDLDQYGHLKCPVLDRVLQQCRDQMLASYDTMLELIQQASSLRKVVETYSIAWSIELKTGDKCSILTRLRLSKVKVVLEESITKGDELAVLCVTTFVMVDENGKKTSIPVELRRQLS